jgi:hypothetical protein
MGRVDIPISSSNGVKKGIYTTISLLRSTNFWLSVRREFEDIV